MFDVEREFSIDFCLTLTKSYRLNLCTFSWNNEMPFINWVLKNKYCFNFKLKLYGYKKNSIESTIIPFLRAYKNVTAI